MSTLMVMSKIPHFLLQLVLGVDRLLHNNERLETLEVDVKTIYTFCCSWWFEDREICMNEWLEMSEPVVTIFYNLCCS